MEKTNWQKQNGNYQHKQRIDSFLEEDYRTRGIALTHRDKGKGYSFTTFHNFTGGNELQIVNYQGSGW